MDVSKTQCPVADTSLWNQTVTISTIPHGSLKTWFLFQKKEKKATDDLLLKWEKTA